MSAVPAPDHCGRRHSSAPERCPSRAGAVGRASLQKRRGVPALPHQELISRKARRGCIYPSLHLVRAAAVKERSRDEWDELSRLLDEALDIAPELREAWLQEQRAAHPGVIAELEALLGREAALDEAGFLD